MSFWDEPPGGAAGLVSRSDELLALPATRDFVRSALTTAAKLPPSPEKARVMTRLREVESELRELS